jgi:hypothetical protein
MAICQAIPSPEHWSPLLVAASSIAAGVGTVLLTGRLAERLLPESPAGSIARWGTALSFPLLGWAVVGLEVAPLALLLCAAALAALRWEDTQEPRALVAAAILLTLAVLIRTDAVFPALVLAAWCLWQAPKDRRRWVVGILGGAIAAALLASTLFSIAYYGAPFPNTYYLKLTGIPLSVRLHRGIADLAWAGLTTLGIPTLLGAVSLVCLPMRRRRGAWLLAAMASAQIVYALYVGGDSYDAGEAGGRFIAVVLPLVVALASVGAAVLARQTTGWIPSAVVAALVVPLLLLRIVDVRPGQGSQLGPYASHGLLFRTAGLVVLLTACLTAVAVCRRLRPIARRSVGPVLAGFLGLAVVTGAGGAATIATLRGPDSTTSFDTWMLRVGLAARSATDPQAVIGSGAIGELGYYSQRTIVDFLGYTDPTVARRPPDTPNFVPGHDKFDVAYSVGRLRPDLLLWPPPTATEVTDLHSYGYVELAPQLWIRTGTTHVHRERLAALVTLLTPSSRGKPT